MILFPLYLSLRAGDNEVFEAQPFDFALVGMATFAIAVGVQLVPWRRAPSVAVLGGLVGGGLLVGGLAAFSIGAFVFPVVLVLLVVLARTIGRVPVSFERRATLGGAVIGYGLVLLLIALVIPPTVD